MLPLYRGKPLHLSSSSSVNNKYGSIAPFSRISSCGFWLVEDEALRIGGNDALTPLVLQSCACLQGIQFLSEADTLERVWQKGRGSRSPCGEEAWKEGSDTKQYMVLGRLLQAVAMMGTVSNRQARGNELFSHWPHSNMKWKFHCSVFCQVLKGKTLANGSCFCINSQAGALLHEPCKSFITRGTLTIKQP